MLNNLYIVCDGVGGNNYGEVASKLTVKKFIEGLKKGLETENAIANTIY